MLSSEKCNFRLFSASALTQFRKAQTGLLPVVRPEPFEIQEKRSFSEGAVHDLPEEISVPATLSATEKLPVAVPMHTPALQSLPPYPCRRSPEYAAALRLQVPDTPP